MERQFLIVGMKPYYNKQVNDILKACDLGIEGGFVKLSEVATVTLSEDVTEDQKKRQSRAIKDTYEQLGCINVQVVEIPITA